MQCSQCQHENPASTKFCGECGAPLTKNGKGSGPGVSYAELQHHLIEAREQQAATGEILRVISRLPTDLQPVFDTIAERAMQLCGASVCGVARFDGELLHLVALANVDPEGAAALRSVFPRPPGSWSAGARAVLTRSIVHIPDIRDDPELEITTQAQVAGFRSALSVPMLREGRPIGAIAVGRPQAGPFSERQIAVLQMFADQAVIAIENVRLFKELEARNRDLTEALEQQTATSEILRVISSSPTDIQPVLDAVARSAARLCEAFDASVLRLDGDRLVLAAHHGPIHAGVGAFTLSLSRGTIGGRTVLEARTVHLTDVQAEAEEFPEASENARRLGLHTMLSVPLMREGVAIGAIQLPRKEVRVFTARQVALLQTFADQAVIAIENVRLFKELEARNRDLTDALERQTATGEVLRVISRSPTDTQPVFDTIVESAARLCTAESAAVYRFEGEMAHFVAGYHFNPETAEAYRQQFPRPLGETDHLQRVLDGSVLNIADIASDPHSSARVVEIYRARGVRSTVFVPMLREGRAIGAIGVSHRESGAFSDQRVELLKTFADQAVIAIENVRLFTELQQKNLALSEALHQQTATGEVLKIMSRSAFDLGPVFETLAESAVRLCEADRAFIYRFDGGLLRMAAAYNTPPELRDFVEQHPVAPGRQSASARAASERRTIHVYDAAADPEYTYARQFQSGTRLAVPMLKGDDVVGVILIYRFEVRPFSGKQVALVETFADQAVIAIENVRLFNELEARNRELTEALERQTATSEILRVISSAHTDAQPVFDTIVHSAVRLCRATHAAVFVTDGTTLHHPANYGSFVSSDALAAVRGRYPRPLTMDSTPGMTILTRSVFHVPDIEDPAAPESVRRVGRLLGFRSQVAVPMVRAGGAIGAILVSRTEPGRFTDAEVELLKTFSDQAVIAIENVRLFKELEARTGALARSVDQLTALGEVGRAVSSTLDLETVLTTIVSRAVQLSGLDGGVVFEYDEGAEEFVQRVATEIGGALAEARRTTRIRKGEGALGQTAITLEPVQIPDITLPGAYESRLRENLIESGIRAVLAVPIVREGQLIGCLGVTRNRPGGFPTETIELLRTFATQSALAIQNARLFQEIADKGRQLEAASRHKSEFLANMSHELRTPLNAIIGFSEVLLERMFGEVNAKQAEYLQDILSSGQHLLSLINDILDLSKIEAGRMELALAPFHLPQALENALILIRERAARHGIGVTRDLDPRLGELVGDERKIKQVLLNLLSNAVKFTPEGGRISLTARLTDGSVEIAVSDTGVGIAPEDQETIFEEFRQVGGDYTRKLEGTGLGLTLTRKFVEMHGGRIWVESAVGEGSTFTFTLPVGPETRLT